MSRHALLAKVSLSGRPFQGENVVVPFGDAVSLCSVEGVYQPGAGITLWALHCCRRAADAAAEFLPPMPIRRLRDLTRYRMSLVADVGAEKNRVEKLLEDTQIKLSVVASDIFGSPVGR